MDTLWSDLGGCWRRLFPHNHPCATLSVVMTRRLIPMIALVVGLAAPAWGQNFNDDELALVRGLGVTVQDEVKDGCLPKPEVLKTAAELVFRSAGIVVVDPTVLALPEHFHHRPVQCCVEQHEKGQKADYLDGLAWQLNLTAESRIIACSDLPIATSYGAMGLPTHAQRPGHGASLLCIPYILAGC